MGGILNKILGKGGYWDLTVGDGQTCFQFKCFGFHL